MNIKMQEVGAVLSGEKEPETAENKSPPPPGWIFKLYLPDQLLWSLLPS